MTCVCQMCDIALEYDAHSAEFSVSKSPVREVHVRQRHRGKGGGEDEDEDIIIIIIRRSKGDEVFARRLQKEEDARGSNHGRSFGSWIRICFQRFLCLRRRLRTTASRTSQARTNGDGRRGVRRRASDTNNMFSRTTTVRYYQTSEYWNEFLCGSASRARDAPWVSVVRVRRVSKDRKRAV